MAATVGPKKVHRYSNEFKIQAVRLSLHPEIQTRDVAQHSSVHARQQAQCSRWPKEVSMANSGQSFREFEQAGWENPAVVTKYHEHLSGVTTQSTGALLDAAGVANGSRVLDVATGAGYIAGAAAKRGADPIGRTRLKQA